MSILLIDALGYLIVSTLLINSVIVNHYQIDDLAHASRDFVIHISFIYWDIVTVFNRLTVIQDLLYYYENNTRLAKIYL